MELFHDVRDRINKEETLVKHNHLLKEVVSNHKVFSNQKNILSYVKAINSSLNQGQDRWQGIIQLIQIIPQCSSEVISLNGEKWLRLCSLIISSKASASMKIDACSAISLLMEHIAVIPEVMRVITPRHANNLLPHLIQADNEWKEAALQCAYDYAVIFPSHLTTMKKDIESCMMGTLEEPFGTSTSIIAASSRLYAVMPVSGSNKSSGRGQKLSQLLSLAIKCCDQLFNRDNIIEKQSYDNQDECKLSLNSLESFQKCKDPLKQIILNITCLSNIFTCISEQFAVASSDNNLITFKPAQLLSPILRVLQIEVKPLLKQKVQENLLLALFIPSLHIRAMKLLSYLLSRPVIANSLDEYWGVIKTQIVQTLKTSEQGVAHQTSNSSVKLGISVRIIAYKVLNMLIKVSRGSIDASVDVIYILLKDVMFERETITLQNSRGSALSSISIKGGKKKRKRDTLIGDENKALKKSKISSECIELPFSALELAETICKHSRHTPSAAFKDLFKGLLKLGELIFLQINRIGDHVCFSDSTVRAMLIRSIIALCITPRFDCIPSYLYVMSILQAGMKDTSNVVVEACQNGSQIISFIMANPVLQSISLISPTSFDDDTSVGKEVIEKQNELDDEDASSDNDSDAEIELRKNDDSDMILGEIIPNTTSPAIIEEAPLNNIDVLNSAPSAIESTAVDTKIPCPTEIESDASEGESEVDIEEMEIVASPPKKVARVNRQNNNKESENSPSINEMLASFVDADPDSD